MSYGTGSQFQASVVDPAAVVAALEKQVGCYRSLAKLAERQHEHVLADHTEGLLEVLKEREAVLDEAAVLERTVGPAKRDWAQFVGRLPLDQRRMAETYLAETRRLLAEITAGDERDALALQQRKHRIGSEIRATASATAVNRNYAASAYGRNRPGSLDQTT